MQEGEGVMEEADMEEGDMEEGVMEEDGMEEGMDMEGDMDTEGGTAMVGSTGVGDGGVGAGTGGLFIMLSPPLSSSKKMSFQVRVNPTMIVPMAHPVHSTVSALQHSSRLLRT